MKKTYQLENLDCAHCAALMETGIKKISGVTDASVNFMTQKLIITADDERFDEIMQEVRKTCKKIEPDCIILD
ncbi:MAG: cation transporter [Methanocorpusculum sp.]|uniref:Cation transporter n=1 Tax=Methanocorpusculum petauri TaxID=3002863 RepID=A0ABT4IEJ0_9EURY|nr:cation transporter [Methanocorpusculum petauri]MDE2443099.1 cation transporter [Methanocorpusculum sp.]MCZ0860151.1 cation transporter [Methanocorpusculum petauri]MDE2518760.1 cation transporter [Methanocorpusculum sp.]MDE2522853.1 cation transporter [Methanocorpusculum sp.]MDE2523578.1 cation transporter [Methanocorpusculum sp.]